jgi:hypothetical protein
MKSIFKALLWLIGISALVMIPATGGKLFNAVTNKLEPKEAIPENLKNAKAFTGSADEAKPAETAQAANATENEEEGMAHYMEGLKLFQAGKKEDAKREWEEGAKLDPGNKDIQKALKRLAAAEQAASEQASADNK